MNAFELISLNKALNLDNLFEAKVNLALLSEKVQTK
jgi:hypothetical protein